MSDRLLDQAVEQVFDQSMTSLALLEPPAEAADDLETRAALVAGRLNRAHGDLVALAARLLDGDRWAALTKPAHESGPSRAAE